MFSDEDPDVDLGRRGPVGKEGRVSITGSGHVRLRERESSGVHRPNESRQGRCGRAGRVGKSLEGEEGRGSRGGHSFSPQKVTVKCRWFEVYVAARSGGDHGPFLNHL